MMISLRSLVLPLASLLACLGPAAAEPAADFYKGKTISVLIPSAPGGGYDLYARFLTRFLGKHIPGSPAIIPKNMPGAGGILAGNNLVSLVAPDGLTLAGFQFTNTLNQIVKTSSMKFDMRKLAWIGSMNSTPTICAVSGPAKDLKGKDLLNKEIVIGAAGGSTAMIPVLLNNLAHARFKVVQGYPSTSNVQIAMESGEVQGLCGWSWDGARVNAKSMIDHGKAKVGLVIGTPNAELKAMKVPPLLDLMPANDDKKVLEVILSPQEYSRPFAFPPGVPADRVRVVRDAFKKMMEDPEVKSEAERMGLELSYLGPDQIETLLNKTFDMPPAILKRAAAELAKAGFKE